MTIDQLKQLTEDERNAARARADSDAIAQTMHKPERSDYDDSTPSKYSSRVIQAAAWGLFLLALAAGNISMFRMFKIGNEHYLMSMDGYWRGVLVGVSTFLLAELMVVLSTIAWSVFYNKDDWQRFWLIIPIVLGAAMAIVGNWTVTQPHTIFGWLDTLSPPAAFLTMGLISKELILNNSARRQGNERAYQRDRAAYNEIAANPRNLPTWKSAYMKRLRDALRQSNAHGIGAKGRREIMDQMTSRDWVLVVQRELAEDAIWEQAAVNPTQPAIMSGQGDIQQPSDKPAGSGWLPEPQPSASNKSPKR